MMMISFVSLWRFIVAALIVLLALSMDWISTKLLFPDAETQTMSTIRIRRPFSSSDIQNELVLLRDGWDDDNNMYHYPTDVKYEAYEDADRTNAMPIDSFFFPHITEAATVETTSVIEVVDAKQQEQQQQQPHDEPISLTSNGGHWEHVYNFNPPYKFSPQVCAATCIDERDCIKAKSCATGLMNWVYVVDDKKKNSSGTSSGKRYPKFNVDGFRKNMRNSRILFLGSSLVRQQVQALVWTLGYKEIKWEKTHPAKEKAFDSCTATRYCMLDKPSNISVCYQFMGSMATKIYHEGNYTLDHSKRGHGDSSCLFNDTMIAELNTKFDVIFVQNVAWYLDLGTTLDSPTSPSTWISTVVPSLYQDAMGLFLSKVSRRTKTILVLGQVGTNCKDKNEPEAFEREKIPNIYGWSLAPTLWDTSISLIRDKASNVQLVDVRDPVMQSVHAHPYPDCLHLCMNSAAVNIYLDKYWTEVFSKYSESGTI